MPGKVSVILRKVIILFGYHSATVDPISLLRSTLFPVLSPVGLYTLLNAIKLIHNTAAKYYCMNYSDSNAQPCIGSDDLFPIVVYCVIQSNLQTPHCYITFTEDILPNGKILLYELFR